MTAYFRKAIPPPVPRTRPRNGFAATRLVTAEGRWRSPDGGRGHPRAPSSPWSAASRTTTKPHRQTACSPCSRTPSSGNSSATEPELVPSARRGSCCAYESPIQHHRRGVALDDGELGGPAVSASRQSSHSRSSRAANRDPGNGSRIRNAPRHCGAPTNRHLPRFRLGHAPLLRRALGGAACRASLRSRPCSNAWDRARPETAARPAQVGGRKRRRRSAASESLPVEP